MTDSATQKANTELKPGDRYELTYVVGAHDCASRLALDAEDDFPEVLATSRMVGLMELAAARLMRRVLRHGELSVGVRVDVQHLGPTPAAAAVKVVAEYSGMEGRLHAFDISVSDPAGVCGRAFHTRACIAHERFLGVARRRGHSAR